MIGAEEMFLYTEATRVLDEFSTIYFLSKETPLSYPCPFEVEEEHGHSDDYGEEG
jgi:hypothetical protein